MVPVVGLALFVVGSIAWLVWRAQRCGSCGCGAQELGKDSRRQQQKAD